MKHRRSAYEEDLACIHDAGFGQVARAASEVLLREVKLRFQGGLVVDLGCGSGILSAAVAAAGHELVGIDYSPAMIQLARQRVPSGQFHVGCLLGFELPNCVAVAAVGECINYLFDPKTSIAKLGQLFRRIFGALIPGGLLLFDAAGPGRGRLQPTKHHVAGPDWAVLVTTQEAADHRHLTRHITSFREVGGHYRRSDECHRLLLYPPATVLALLRQAGFRAKRLAGYGDCHLPCGWTAYLARKPHG